MFFNVGKKEVWRLSARWSLGIFPKKCVRLFIHILLTIVLKRWMRAWELADDAVLYVSWKPIWYMDNGLYGNCETLVPCPMSQIPWYVNTPNRSKIITVESIIHGNWLIFGVLINSLLSAIQKTAGGFFTIFQLVAGASPLTRAVNLTQKYLLIKRMTYKPVNIFLDNKSILKRKYSWRLQPNGFIWRYQFYPVNNYNHFHQWRLWPNTQCDPIHNRRPFLRAGQCMHVFSPHV